MRAIVRSGQIGHAYLLSGPKGVGKSALAHAFAQSICCREPDAGDLSQPCGVCRSCRNIARGSHPDVEEFNLATQAALAEKPGRGATLTIDTVRRIRANAALFPLESSRRILLVDDAETLQEPAQQALLKTLEEPPSAVTIVVVADEAESLLATVRSRCREIVVRPVAEPEVARALLDAGADEALAQEVAALSRGRPAWARDAVANPRLLAIRRQEQEAARVWVGSSPYDRLVTAFKLGEQYGKRRDDVVGTVQAAIQVLRESMFRAAGAAGGEPPAPSVASTASELGRGIAASLTCLSDLEANVRPRLALETMVLSWPNMEPRSQ